MPEDIVGVPTEEQALAAVGGGGKETYPDAEKERIATQIRDAAISNAQWRASLPFDQQLALANVPTLTVPPAEEKPAELETTVRDPNASV